MLRSRWLPLATWITLLVALFFIYKPDLIIRKNDNGKLPTGPRDLVVPVSTGQAIERGLDSFLNTTGSLVPLETILVFPKVEARVKSVFYEVGAEVFPGDYLLESEETDFRLGIQEARMALQLDLSRLGMAETPKGPVDLEKLPNLVRAGLLEKNALAKMERVRRLGGAASIEDRDQADTEAKVARANLENSLLEAKAALAGVNYREAQLAIAEQRLRDSKIVAPESRAPGGVDFRPFLEKIPGRLPFVVLSRNVREGELLRFSHAEPVFRLGITQLLKLQFSLPEREFSRIALGMKGEISVEPYPGKVFPGVIARISPAADPATRTFQVELAVGNSRGELRPGFFARVQIATGKKEKALMVPQEAVYHFAGSAKVFVIFQGKAKSVEVKTGQRIVLTIGRLETWVEVSGDLKADDTLALSGQQYLADGTPVREKMSNGITPQSLPGNNP
ncbi:MAG: efflux RND transporter periplasmic adaptor subunit [Gemmataceae bacterium]|nr:efflux RND transporter periplasmic adaptor subunit [Gemmataceae bacterium]